MGRVLCLSYSPHFKRVWETVLRFLNWRSDRGSFTVEAALVFSAVFLCILVLIYMCLLMYQQVYIQALADRAVQRGAAVWNNPEKDIEMGRVRKSDLSAGGLYWRFIDAKEEEKLDRLEKYIEDRLSTYGILNNVNQNPIHVKMKNYVLYKKLEVNIENKYKIPIGNLLKVFGLEEYFVVNVNAQAVISEPVEFIRNTDFILDIEKELEEKNPKLKELGDNARGIIVKIRQNISKLFKNAGGAI